MACGAVILTCPNVWAETGDDIQNLQQQLINQQLRENEIKNIEKLSPYNKNVFTPETKKEKSKTEHCANVKKISFVGNTILSDRKIQNITKNYENKCLYVSDINQMMNDITNKYIDRGYITSRAYMQMPQTRLSDGILDIGIIEGTINKITGLTNAEQITAFPLMQYRELNLRDIEQGLDQMNRLGANNTKMEISASSQQDGTSDIIIINEPQGNTNIDFNIDNYGSKSTGYYRAGLRLSQDNLIGLNDNINMMITSSVVGDMGYRFSKSAIVGISVPFGYWTFSNNLSYSTYKTSFEMPVSGDRFFNLGDTLTNTFFVDRILWRGQTYKIGATASLIYKNNENRMRVYDLETINMASSRALTLINFDLPVTMYFPKSTLYLKPGIVQGIDLFDSASDKNSLYTQRAQYTAAKFYGYYNHGFTYFNFMTSVDAQYSDDELFSTESFYIGGSSSVRGFHDDSNMGDSGYVIRNDLMFILSEIFESENALLKRFSPSVFFDFGQTFPNNQNQYNSTMAGAGVKLSFNYWFFDTSATYARTVIKEDWMTENYSVYLYAGISSRF